MDRFTALVPVHEDSGALGQGAARIGVTRVGGLDRLLGHYSNDFDLNNLSYQTMQSLLAAL